MVSHNAHVECEILQTRNFVTVNASVNFTVWRMNMCLFTSPSIILRYTKFYSLFSFSSSSKSNKIPVPTRHTLFVSGSILIACFLMLLAALSSCTARVTC